MSKNISSIPYTEVVERVKSLARLRGEAEDRVRAAVGDYYIHEIPNLEDWQFLEVDSQVLLKKRHNAGTVSVNTGSATLTFSADAVITSDHDGTKIKVNGNDLIYKLTFVNSTTGTIVPVFSGTKNATSQSYNIFRDLYSLPSDFDRFPKNQSLRVFRSGRPEPIKETPLPKWNEEFNVQPATYPERVRLMGYDTLGHREIQINPPSKDDVSVPFTYFRTLAPLRQETAGTITIEAGSSGVVGSTDCRFLNMNTGDFIRADNLGTANDSEWYRILSIAHDSSLTIQGAWGSSSVATANFTISSALEIPDKLHLGVLYGALIEVLADQNDPIATFYTSKMEQVVNNAKRIFKTRLYDQQVETIAEDWNYRR